MASSLALIPWNQPDANKAVVKIDENSRPEGGRWALVLHALLHPSPGRTLEKMYTSLGGVLEKQANRAAYSLGLGPHIVAGKIKFHFGSGEDRVQRLELLRTSVPPKLEKRCLKLMQYALPAESANVQCQAFKDIVDLVTLFPGLRIIFLQSKALGTVTSIAALWDRSTGYTDQEWTFWQTLAAICLTETTISALLEGCSISEWSDCKEQGLSVIERLMVEHDSSALCIRYLSAVLDLPGFWQDSGKIHSYIANKLCSKLVQVLKDIGVDVLTLGPGDESEPPFDYEGVDFLASTALTGISNWLFQVDRKNWSAQPWPRAAELLPRSSACAATTLQDISPAGYQDAKLNVTVDSENITTNTPDTNRDNSIADLHCSNDSTSSVHTKISDQDDTRGPDSDYEDRGDEHSMDSSQVSSENGTDILSSPEDEGYDSETQFDDAEDVHDFECKRDIGQGSNLNGDSDSDPVNSGMRTFVRMADSQNPTPHPSFEARRKEAEEWKIILHQRQNELGDDHPDTLNAMDDLAWTHHELGEYKAARDLRTVVLEKRRILLGDEDPLTLHSMHTLGATFGALGQFKKAEGLQVVVLEKQREALGEAHPETLSIMKNLAVTYGKLGLITEAESLEVQVLQKRRELLGEGHPDTLYSMSDLAVTYYDLGRLEESERLEVQVLEKMREVLGEDHPQTVHAMSCLGWIYLGSGQLDTAEEFLAATVRKQREVLGGDHPDTLLTMGNLAMTYHNQGQFGRAEELYVMVLDKQRKISGDDHRDTQWTIRALAGLYRSMDKLQDAEELEALLGAEEM